MQRLQRNELVGQIDGITPDFTDSVPGHKTTYGTAHVNRPMIKQIARNGARMHTRAISFVNRGGEDGSKRERNARVSSTILEFYNSRTHATLISVN
jgi:hypothetical protein